MDREKLIKGLEVCFDSSKECNGCPYITTPYCRTTLRNDVIAMLKEHETMMQCIKGKCRICPHCTNCDVDENGKAVKWE